MERLEFIIEDSIEKIARPSWDNLFPGTREGYRFFQLLESAHLDQFKFYYFTFRAQGVPVFIAPAFCADFDLSLAAEGFLKKAILSARKVFPRFMVMRTLFFGSPFGENGILGMDSSLSDKDALVRQLAQKTSDFCRHKKVSLVIFKDFLDKDARLLGGLQAHGFFKAESFPSAVARVDFASFEEYLKSLGHSTRKGLRKKLKNSYSEYEIKVVEAQNVDGMVEDIYRLYANTLSEGSVKFEELNKGFFIEAARKMSPEARFFLYYVNGRLGAFNLCFIYPDLFIDKFIGFDYDISGPSQLYFISWCYNVEYCIKNRIPYYQTGQTDYDAKVRLGARLVRLNAYVRHKNSLVNYVLKLLSGHLSPGNTYSVNE